METCKAPKIRTKGRIKMAKLLDMKKQRETALAKAESIITASETGNRALTEGESADVDAAMAEVHALNPQIDRVEKMNTLRSAFPTGRVIAEQSGTAATVATGRRGVFSAEYAADFAAYCASRGTSIGAAIASRQDELGGFAFPGTPRQSAASYEGSNANGGFAVPSQVEGVFVPLAPPEFGVQRLATVVPTTMDTRYPRVATRGTAAAKAESGGSANSFGGTDATLEQFTLSAYMVGHASDASWELLQDVNQFQGFITDDVLLSIAILKESWFISGTGSGQAQGLVGNTGVGVAAAAAEGTNLLGIDATFDVMGLLNAVYHPRASWLMSRASSIELRKAQKQSNLFEPVFVRSNGQDYLHGYPVEYSTAMPAIAAAATPVLFGDFKSGYIIGERGGAGVNVKILDQPKALQGLLTVLGYQRVDGRVRRSEAIQAITLHA
jgi:HK97 family phage major capsid protein